MAHPFVATMIDGDLEGCGPSQPLPAANQHHFTAPTERTPSRESAINGPSVRGNDDRWRPGGLRSLAAVAGRKPTPFYAADGADALQGIGQQWPIRSSQPCSVATWRACGPSSQPLPAANQHHFTASTERTPSRGSASNGPSVPGNHDR